MNKDPKEIEELAMLTQEGSVTCTWQRKFKGGSRGVLGVFMNSIWALTRAGEGGREGR